MGRVLFYLFHFCRCRNWGPEMSSKSCYTASWWLNIKLNIKSFECWVHDLPAAFYRQPGCLAASSFLVSIIFPLNSFWLQSVSSPPPAPSSLPATFTSHVLWSSHTHLWPPQHRSLLDQWDHIIESPSLPFMPLVLLYALIPHSFEPQHTRWYRKEDNSCLLWERTSNLRCPELRFLARVLSIPKAPPRCWKFFNAFKGQC